MWTENDVRKLPQRTIFRQRLLMEDIQRGSGNPLLSECLHQRLLVYHIAARDIDEERLWLHCFECLSVEHGPCLSGQWHTGNHNITLGQHGMKLPYRIIVVR